MMNVPPLKALCVGKVTTEIWRNKVTLDVFVTYVRDMTGRVIFMAGDSNKQKDYLDELENIFKQIMGLIMPNKIKVRLCAAMSILEQDAYSCCQDAAHLFVNSHKENVLFLMSQLCFTPTGLIDRFKTFVRSIMCSRSKLQINYLLLKKFCCLNKVKITECVNSMYNDKYSRKILQKLCNQKVNLHSYIPDQLVEEALRSSNLIFEYMYDTCTDTAKPRYLCRMLILILNSGNACEGWNKRLKLIFIYERLSEEIWQKVINLYGKDLVKFFLMTEQIDYCIHFYKQVCLCAPQYCHDILEYAFDNLYRDCDEYGHSTKIFEKLNEETFFCLWFETPSEIKNSFVSAKDTIYKIICFKDYEHISTILNDTALTEQNKNHLIDFLIVHFKCYSDYTEDEVLLKRLVKEFRNDCDFVDMPTWKSILEKRFFYMHDKFDPGTILSDKALTELKTLVNKDDDFIKNVMKSYIKFSYLLDVTEDALKFKFGDEKTELLKYVTEKFVYEEDFMCVFHLVVDEIKDFDLMETEDPYHKFIIDIFKDATVKRAINKVLKETDLFKNYIQRIIGPETDKFLVIHKWNPYRDEHKPYFFEDILTRAEIKKYLKSYLLSETALKDILNAYILVKAYDLQTVDKYILIMVQRSFMLFREYWLKSYDLYTEFVFYFLNNVKKVYNAHYEPVDEEQLLPNQSREDHEKIVNAFYKVFVSEIQEDRIQNTEMHCEMMDLDESNTTAYSVINKWANLRISPLI